MTESPKPTALLIATSVLVIAFSLFLVSAALAAFTVTWDPCSLIGGAIILPLPAALAVQQYRATFRGVAAAALTAAILLFIVGGFAAFAFATTFGEIAMGSGELPWFGLLLPMLGVATVGLFGGWLNLRWRNNLPPTTTDAAWRFSLQEALTAVAAISVLTGLTASFIRSTPPRYAENVSVADAPFGLPASATNVSFCQGFRVRSPMNSPLTKPHFVNGWLTASVPLNRMRQIRNSNQSSLRFRSLDTTPILPSLAGRIRSR
ncbi:hypothetical protein [Rhodopirellula halodulae]|uniref:hypothetical protein n=1 Tax=Rhodopirellula halodulae TaxID=2894198 RepID=UPI001E4EBB8B|nr:hypothetical protein [Rhodopirellula sp. JC737]MCC9657977.1 hypothetical protein [Rhodopirellula sp. JC737]